MLSKTIVVISSSSLLEQVVNNRLTPFFNLLLEKDFKVIFVCPSSHKAKDNAPQGIHLVEVHISETKSTSFIRRALKEINASAYLLAAARKQDADAYLITIPSMFLGFLAPIYLYNSKVVLDIRDITWEYLSDDVTLHKYSKRLMRFTFNKIVNFYKGISVTNKTELSYINKVWRKDSSSLLIPNGIMQQQFDKVQAVKAANNNTLTVTYIGNIGIAQHLETLVLAAKELPDTIFRIIGSGVEQDKISNLILNHKLDNIELIGRVPWDKVIDYYNETDILYAQLSPEFSGAMPSKLYEYLATGKYIIYGGEGQAATALSDFQNNHVIDPCNPVKLAEAIESVKKDPKLREISYENRNKIKENYIRENNARKLIDFIRHIVG